MTHEAPTTAPVRAALPLAGLLALSFAAFLTMLTETVPAGLLPQIGAGLDSSPAHAGQLLTVYAAGSMLAAIPLTALTRSLPRRPLLLATLLTVAAVNLITALSGGYAITLGARVVAGAAAGVQWAMIAGYAMRLVGDADRGRAIAVAMAGVPLALAFGVPVGTFAGDLLGWRATFAAMAAAALIAGAWILWRLPALPGESAGERMPLRGVLLRPGLIVILVAAFAFEVAHMNLYTYVATFLARAGLGDHVGGVLLVLGVAAIAGLWAAGTLVDAHLRAVVVTAFALFSVSMLAFAVAGHVTILVLAGVAIWGLALGAAPTMLQAAAARVAGSATDVAQSMLVTVLNGGMAAGAATGGVALAGGGVGVLPAISCAIFCAALALALLARRHAFPPPTVHDGGPRRQAAETGAHAERDVRDRRPVASGS